MSLPIYWSTILQYKSQRPPLKLKNVRSHKKMHTKCAVLKRVFVKERQSYLIFEIFAIFLRSALSVIPTL